MSDRPISDDHRTLLQIAQGGKSGEMALELLYRRHRPKLLGLLRKKGLSIEEAEDIVQDVFVQVIKSATTFRGESAVTSWMHRIALNAMVDLFRGTNREVQLDEEGWEHVHNTAPADTACPLLADPKLALQDCYDKAYAAFAKAHPDAADLIYQTVHHEEWSGRDIARFLGRAEGAAREYLSQCKKKFKEFAQSCRDLLGAQS